VPLPTHEPGRATSCFPTAAIPATDGAAVFVGPDTDAARVEPATAALARTTIPISAQRAGDTTTQ